MWSSRDLNRVKIKNVYNFLRQLMSHLCSLKQKAWTNIWRFFLCSKCCQRKTKRTGIGVFNSFQGISCLIEREEIFQKFVWLQKSCFYLHTQSILSTIWSHDVFYCQRKAFRIKKSFFLALDFNSRKKKVWSLFLSSNVYFFFRTCF